MQRLGLLPFLLVGAAAAQTTTPVVLAFSGTEVTVTFGTASGTLSPLGAATMSITGTPTGQTTGNFAFAFKFTNGDTLAASGPGNIGNTTVSGTATVTGGTGAFANATGSFSWTVTVDLSTDPNPFTITGTGTITSAAAPTFPLVGETGCGSSLPIVPASGPRPAAATAGQVCSVVICENGGGSTLPIVPASGLRPADSTAPVCRLVGLVDVDGSGSTLPILVFEGGGSTLPVLVFDGSGGSTLPVLVFDGSGGTLPLLASDGTGSTLPIVTDVCDGCAPHAASGNGTFQASIFTAVQSAAANYSAAASCPGLSGSCWITLPAPTGNVAAGSRAGITAVVNPQGLQPGMYTANVAVTINGAPVNTPVSLLITPAAPMLALSQSGLRFQAVSGAAPPAAQTVWVSGAAFSALASTSGGGNWLSVTPGSGSVSVQANPAGLAPGNYYGRVDFISPGAVNSPQSVQAMLTVLPSTAKVGPVVSSTALVFTSSAPQTIQVSNPSNQSLTISTQIAFAVGSGWFTAGASGGAAAPSQAVKLTVSVNPAGLAAGVYVGTLDIHAAETGSDVPVAIVLVVAGAPATCKPTQLTALLTNLEGNFQRTAGFPVPLEALVVDDCGNPMNSGAVVAYFGGSDIPVSLTAIGNGRWAGSWLPQTLAGGPAPVGLLASSANGLYGSTGVNGTLTANPTAPLIYSGGVASAASLSPTRIAPGEFISIFGANLAGAFTQAGAFPYPPALAGVQVLMGGEALPLEVASSGQINALVPYDVALNTPQQILVQSNGVTSLPEPVVVTAAQPGVFTQDQSGTGAGAIDVIKPDGTLFLNTPAHPASAGDVLVIYGTGMGAVNPAVASGAAAPLATYTYTTNTVTATVGGQSAKVQFAGLTPGFAGLYQVNVLVPAGVAAGAKVPVVLSVAGQSSPTVTAAIQ